MTFDQAILNSIEEAIQKTRAAAIEECARIADSFTCGGCGMDGKSGIAIRALGAIYQVAGRMREFDDMPEGRPEARDE